MIAFAATGPSAYWYLSRATGAVSLILLTAAVVFGVLGQVRFAAPPRWPRFAIDALHRDSSLLVMLVLAVHIATSVLDKFAPIALSDAVIPFASKYRPLWLGLGAFAFDLLLALVATSLLRRRLGYRSWRAVHWLAYVSWPVAVLHGLGTGSDTKIWWMLVLTVICVGAVLVAVLRRLADRDAREAAFRKPAVALSIITPLGFAIFALAGPLQRGWARRAGTPSNLLPKSAARVAPTRRSQVSTTVLSRQFSARLTGTLRQSPSAGGEVVTLSLRLSGGVSGRLRVRMGGSPLPGGGLSMAGSQVDLAAAGVPSVLEGHVMQLQGQQFLARVANGSGSVADLRATLNIDADRVTGTLVGTPG